MKIKKKKIYKKGCTLLDKKYKEGESTWGCKSGVLDIEDVESFIYQIKIIIKRKLSVEETIDIINKMYGDIKYE